MKTKQETSPQALTKKLTAFASFDALIDAGMTGYSPTLMGRTRREQYEADMLASYFDQAMQDRNSKVRAWPAR